MCLRFKASPVTATLRKGTGVVPTSSEPAITRWRKLLQKCPLDIFFSFPLAQMWKIIVVFVHVSLISCPAHLF